MTPVCSRLDHLTDLLCATSDYICIVLLKVANSLFCFRINTKKKTSTLFSLAWHPNMSDSFEVWNNDYIDDKSKSIIDCFIRNESKSLNQLVPKEINAVILFYIDDHFMMYRGSYQWKIKNPNYLKCVLSSQPNEVFNSNVFEICKLKWMIKLCPNGYQNTNGFMLYVSLLTMPKSWKSIFVQQTILFHETKSNIIQSTDTK